MTGFSALLFLLSFTWGQYGVPMGQVVRILGRVFCSLFGAADWIQPDWSDQAYRVVMYIRFPRVLLCSAVGVALSLSGCLFQALFRNPLVSPGLLGASQGAAFGAAGALLLGASRPLVNGAAFGCGLLSVLLVFVLSRPVKVGRTLALVLCGLLVSTLFQAGVSFLKLVADPLDQLPAITYWLMGSLAGATRGDLVWLLPLLPPCLVLLWALRRPLTALTLPETEARSLGVNVPLCRGVLLIVGTVLTAASVAVSGVIGWVGLMVPHGARLLAGDDQGSVLALSASLGWGFLLLVDNVARLTLVREIPLGILTALIGAPFYFWLLLRRGGAGHED